jgi:hypothetical protein
MKELKKILSANRPTFRRTAEQAEEPMPIVREHKSQLFCAHFLSAGASASFSPLPEGFHQELYINRRPARKLDSLLQLNSTAETAVKEICVHSAGKCSSFPFSISSVGNSLVPASVVWQEITSICRLKSPTSNQDQARPIPSSESLGRVVGNLWIPLYQQKALFSSWWEIFAPVSVILNTARNFC